MTTRLLRLWPCLAALLALGLPVLTHAAHDPVGTPVIINVPSAAYPTIQSGVDASHDGDTVLVADGTYTGDGNRDIDFHGKSLTLTSQNGPTETIIDCGGYKSTDGSGNHRGFYIHSYEKKGTISGFTVKKGYETYVSGIPDSNVGGGIYTFNSSTTIRNCIITGNTADDGGGIYDTDANNYGTITLANCTVSSNIAHDYGGGILNADYNDSDSTIILTDCTIMANTAQNGGGVFNENENFRDKIRITDCLIANNKAYNHGGGLLNINGVDVESLNSTIMLTNCTVYSNTAQDGGGLYNTNYNNPK